MKDLTSQIWPFLKKYVPIFIQTIWQALLAQIRGLVSIAIALLAPYALESRVLCVILVGLVIVTLVGNLWSCLHSTSNDRFGRALRRNGSKSRTKTGVAICLTVVPPALAAVGNVMTPDFATGEVLFLTPLGQLFAFLGVLTTVFLSNYGVELVYAVVERGDGSPKHDKSG